MRAVGTNILVRFIVGDDETQFARARHVISEGDVFVGTTVLLETGWVLRAAYGYTQAQVADALRSLAGISGVVLEEPLRLAHALDWTAQGLDFADALHLAGSAGCAEFITFDRRFARRAAKLAELPVVEP